MIIIHPGTNDIEKDADTFQKIKKVILTIKEYETNDNIEIALSSIIHRSDHDFEDIINGANRKVENLFKGKGRIFKNNNNVISTSLYKIS